MIDTHVHLLEPDRFTYEWTKGFSALSRRFDHSDFQIISLNSVIQAGVFMEVDCEESSEEAHDFYSKVEDSDGLIRVVVAAGQPESPEIERAQIFTTNAIQVYRIP